MSGSGVSQRGYFLSGGAWTLGCRVGSAIFVLVTQALLARFLHPEQYGVYEVLTSIVAVAAFAGQLGLNYAVVRMVSTALAREAPGEAGGTIMVALVLVGASGLGIMALTVWPLGPWVTRFVIHQELTWTAAVLIGAWIMLAGCQGIVAESFRGLHRIKAAAVTGGFLSSALFMVVLTVAWLGAASMTVAGVVMLMVACVAVVLAVTGLALARTLKSLPAFRYPRPRSLLLIAWPAWVTGITLIATRHADLWALSAVSGPGEVALYGAGSRLADLVSFPLMVVNAVIAPTIARVHSLGEQGRLEALMRTAAMVASVPALLLLVAFAAGPDSILEALYGPFYGAGALVLVAIGTANLVNAATGPCTLALLMTGHQIVAMAITLAAALLIVAGALVLGGRYGANGVALVSAAVISIQNLVTLLAARKCLGVWTGIGYRRRVAS
jgi:O-antigen/teichoic acid export membrane protein